MPLNGQKAACLIVLASFTVGAPGKAARRCGIIPILPLSVFAGSPEIRRKSTHVALARVLPKQDGEPKPTGAKTHMTTRSAIRALLISAVAFTLYVALGVTTGAQAPLAVGSARVTVNGTSNIHAYTASTATVNVTRAQFAAASAGTEFWANALKPGTVEAFEVAIPAATLTSPREGLDKNMHKALLVKEHQDITFRLLRLEPRAAAPDALRAVGVLKVAGVEREVTFDITAERKGSALSVQGQTQLLMTDFGIKPPTAMLGMLKTDPKVSVAFEVLLESGSRPTTTIH